MALPMAWTCCKQYKISHRKMTDVSAIRDGCRLELHQNIYPTSSHGLQTMTQSSVETNSLEQCNSPISCYVLAMVMCVSLELLLTTNS